MPSETVPDVMKAGMVDLQFPLAGRALPVDHADLLWQALCMALPWLEKDPVAGVHPVSGLNAGAGECYLSRRSRLSLRLTEAQADLATAALSGTRLTLSGYEVDLGQGRMRPLTYSPVIYAKFVAMTPAADGPVDEAEFIDACQAEFDRRGIRPQIICGKAQRMRVPAGLLSGFSLMLSNLDTGDNLSLQCEGLGIERGRGCGIFVPHKSGGVVGTLE